MNKYSTEEKQQAIDLYFKNGCNMTTVTGTVAHLLYLWLGSKKRTLGFADHSIYYTHKKVNLELLSYRHFHESGA